MRYPDFLSENGRIGFIAPSFGCASEPYRELFDMALIDLKESGYECVLGPNCYEDKGIGISNTPEKCGAEANDFFINDKSDVIISCGGGELMCEVLPYINFEKIAKSKPKWYLGYSDNTNLTLLLNTFCDTASLYGPCAAKFGTNPRHKCVDDAFAVLTGKKKVFNNYKEWFLDYYEPDPESDETINMPVVDISDRQYYLMPYKQTLFNGGELCNNLDFTGRLIGGCLDCLVNLVGTRFDKVRDFNERYKEDGIIWFIEACDLNVLDIRRALWHMENAGWFEYVKGFIIGRPRKYNDTFGDFDHIEAVRGILAKYNVPIVMDTDIGHLFPQIPIISGAVAKVNANGNDFTIEYTLK